MQKQIHLKSLESFEVARTTKFPKVSKAMKLAEPFIAAKFQAVTSGSNALSVRFVFVQKVGGNAKWKWGAVGGVKSRWPEEDIDMERPSEPKRLEEADRAILTRQPFALVARYVEV